MLPNSQKLKVQYLEMLGRITFTAAIFSRLTWSVGSHGECTCLRVKFCSTPGIGYVVEAWRLLVLCLTMYDPPNMGEPGQ